MRSSFAMSLTSDELVAIAMPRDTVRLPLNRIQLDARAQHFRNAPRLGDAAAWGEWRFGIEDFADRTDAGVVEMRHEAFERLPRPDRIARIDLQPRVDERPGQPAPHRALVISGIARAKVAEVARLVVAIARGERAETDRRQQPLAHDLHHRQPALTGQDRVGQRDREQLVGPALGIVAAALGIDDVEEIPTIGRPEPIVERALG